MSRFPLVRLMDQFSPVSKMQDTPEVVSTANRVSQHKVERKGHCEPSSSQMEFKNCEENAQEGLII